MHIELKNIDHSITNLTKLSRFERATLRMLGIDSGTVDALALRRKVGHCTMMYKQTVLEEGPDYVRRTFPPKPPDPRAHLHRQSTTCHPHQVLIPQGKNNLAKFDASCGPLRDFNQLPPEIFPPAENISRFKKNLSAFFRALLM